MFGKTTKSAQADAESANAKFLTQGGFVDQEMAGVYTWLPLGLSVLRKVEQIVREEMNALGALEVFMPSLQPKEYWEKTKRWEGVDILFKLKSQTEKDYALGCTHEEVVTPLVQKFIQSYKEVPLAVYQINTKFRDELRAKSGVLRGREFRMKDMYSFHTAQEDLNKFYYRALQAYVKVFSRCGINVKVVQASGGIFTSNVSHEFQAITPAGEDTLIACESCSFGQNLEIATVKEGDACPECRGKLVKTKGIEVGNIFDLGTKYTDAFEFSVNNAEGSTQRLLMGCYGIGTSRLVGAIVETFHDEKGIIWPESIAPYRVHLVVLAGKDEKVMQEAERLYGEMQKAGIEVLFDDRDESAGRKFTDADLIGLPVRVVVSGRTLEKASVEWKLRTSAESELVLLEDVLPKLTA